jgi:hypothetical protein
VSSEDLSVCTQLLVRSDHQNSSPRTVGGRGWGVLSSYQPSDKVGGGGQEINGQCDATAVGAGFQVQARHMYNDTSKTGLPNYLVTEKDK